MRSMEKLDLLRTAGADPTLAEAIVRIQEGSDYITKDYFDARLKGELQELRNQMLLGVAVVAGLALAISRLLP